MYQYILDCRDKKIVFSSFIAKKKEDSTQLSENRTYVQVLQMDPCITFVAAGTSFEYATSTQDCCGNYNKNTLSPSIFS